MRFRFNPDAIPPAVHNGYSRAAQRKLRRAVRRWGWPEMAHQLFVAAFMRRMAGEMAAAMDRMVLRSAGVAPCDACSTDTDDHTYEGACRWAPTKSGANT